ncbi:MAG: elongation factor Ts [Flavobacteriales bacterium]|nr:translation elongation factor Ts [Flavobacteriaceae bacterium]RZP06869.1 MAG: elongation factor Ts [Flavobacteriales bacterium]
MMKISASEVNNLRKSTGAGMMDCKNALVEANGDLDKAIEILRKKGQKVAAKRADRDSHQGAAIAITNKEKTIGAAIVLACETDFVGKNADFVNLANELANIALNCDSKEDLLKASIGNMNVEEKLLEQTGVIGEKIQINKFVKINAPYVGSYIHAGNKIATVVGLSKTNDDLLNDMLNVSKDIAMQVAAMNPIALNEEGVDSNVIEKEIEIAKDQLRTEGKPEAMLDNIAKGKLKRFFKDNTLINQAFIKDTKISVSDYLSSFDKELTVTCFDRVSIG